MDDETIKEFFDLQTDGRGCIVKLLLYERLKEDSNVVALQEDFDFLIDHRNLVDVKYDSTHFSFNQLRKIYSHYKNNNIDELYILTQEAQNHPYNDLLTKIKEYETPVGNFTLYSVDIPGLLNKYGDLIQNY